jgi:hypothetical protein
MSETIGIPGKTIAAAYNGKSRRKTQDVMAGLVPATAERFLKDLKRFT